MTSHTIITMNRGNSTLSSDGSEYVHTFSQQIDLKGECALAFLSLPNSIYNVTAKKNNHIFYYEWWDPNTSSFQTFDVTYPDSFYTVTQLREYFEFVMTSRGHYLINASGKQEFFLTFAPDSVADKVIVSVKALTGRFSVV